MPATPDTAATASLPGIASSPARPDAAQALAVLGTLPPAGMVEGETSDKANESARGLDNLGAVLDAAAVDISAAVGRLGKRSIGAALERLERGDSSEGKFALAANLFHRKKAEDRSDRAGVRRYIQPANALQFLPHLPENPAERTHAVIRGDFVLCDLIPAIIGYRGRCPHLRIATLGMSTANAATLAELVDSGKVGAVTLVVSHYFESVDRLGTFREVAATLAGRARIAVTRSHAKVITIPTESGDFFVLEGSANLRSSDNIEQVVVVNDPETLAFHAAWLDALALNALA